MSPLYPLRLPPSFREKIWGKRDLSPWFPSDGPRPAPIGEVWYSFEENRVANGPLAGETLGSLIERYGERLMGQGHKPSSLQRRSASDEPETGDALPRAYFPILTKLLFTADRLSVQVHPDDNYALAHEGGPGKAEAWCVAAAEPGARIALGVKEGLSTDELRRSAETGEITDYLNWIEVKPGETYFVPPGTLHALGPGLVICEVQQNSDLTYRFYDYNRPGADGQPRPLHLDQAVAVTQLDARPLAISPFVYSRPDGTAARELLAACRYFAVEKMSWAEPSRYIPAGDGAELLIILEGSGQIPAARNGDDPSSTSGEDYAPGRAYLIPNELASFDLHPETATTAIRAYVPDLTKLKESLQNSDATEKQISTLIADT